MPKTDEKNPMQEEMLEEEIEQTKSKSKLVDNDRTKFYNQTKETKDSNNALIQELREENRELKHLRDQLLAKKRVSTSGARLSATSASGFDKDVKYWRRQLDKEKYLTRRKEEILRSLQDKLREVEERKFGVLEESPLMRTIRQLQNKLDKVMIKYNEVQSIRRMYQRIVKRLNEERVGYDNQLAAIQRSLKGKEHDFEELLLLAHDATHAKKLARTQLREYEQKRDSIKQLREKYIQEKYREIKQRQEAIGRFQQTNAVEKEVRQDDEPQEEKIEPQKDEVQVGKQDLNDYEESFRKLKEVTGVDDANDIIQKFKTQPQTARSLESIKDSYKTRIDELKKQKENLSEKLDRLRFEGGDKTLKRKFVDECEENALNIANRHERLKLKCERIDKIKVNVKAGIQHLASMLQFYRLEGRYNVVVQDSTLTEALGQINDKVKQIFATVKNDADYMPNKFKQSVVSLQDYLNLNLLGKKPESTILQKNNRVARQLEEQGGDDGEEDDKKTLQFKSDKAKSKAKK